MKAKLFLSAAVVGLLALGVLASLPGCGSGGGKKPKAAGDASGASVRRGRFELRVRENGELRPLHSRVVLARAGGKIDWLAAEGAEVKVGDLLFSQDRASQTDWLTRDSAELEAAERNLQEVRRQVQMEREGLDLDRRSREADVDLAKTKLAEVLAGPTKEAVAEARAALASATAAAEDKRASAAGAAELAAKGYLSAAEASSAATDASLAAMDMERSKLALAVLSAGAAKEAREIARLQVERAREVLATSCAEADRQRAELDYRIADATANVANLDRSVASAKHEIEARQVHADTAGVVIYRTMGHHRQEKLEVGSRVWPGIGVLDVADLSQMKVRTQLAEDYVRYLKIGSELRIFVEAPGASRRGRDKAPDPSAAPSAAPPAAPAAAEGGAGTGAEAGGLSARVTWIDRWSRDRSSDLSKADREREGLSGVKVFAIEAELEGTSGRIRPGFRCKVEFPLLEIPDALIVPREAIYGSGPARYVLVSGAGVAAPQRVNVEVLAEDDREAAVRGELQSGQRLQARGQK